MITTVGRGYRLHEAATRLQAEIEWQVSSYCFLILISGYKLTAYILQHYCIHFAALLHTFAVTLQSNCSSAAKGLQYHCKIVALILQWLRTDYKIIAFRTELHHGRRQTKRKRMP